MQFIKELQRRNVIRVAVLYFVGGWLVLQVGDLLFDLMGLPDFALRIVLGILLLGFPVALVFSWVWEITPEGIRRDTGEQPTVTSADTSNKLNIAVIVTVSLAVLVLLGDRFIGRGELAAPAPVATEAEPAASEPAARVAQVAQDPSVAVLPFLNLSNEQEQEYFSDGLADTLLHRLAQVPELRVAARTSAFQFKDKNVDVREIAEQLGVATVLEGSVQRQGERVRITAQLIQGSDGIHLWSGVFDDTLDDIFRLQDEISTEVTAALTAALLDDDDIVGAGIVAGAAAGETESVAAYEAYLKGREALARGTVESANEAVAQLELAVELDPEYALAWAYLIEAYISTATLGTVAYEAVYAPSLRAAERSVAIAPELVEGQLALARALLFNQRWKESDEAIERAFELGPNNAAAVRAMAELTNVRGYFRDALRLTERAVLLDPLDPRLQMDLAWTKINIGNVDEGLRLSRELVEANPENLDLAIQHANQLRRAGRPVESKRAYLAIHQDNPDYLRSQFFIADVWLSLGDADAALDAIERAEAIAPDRAYDDRARICYHIGDMECFAAAADQYIAYQRENGSEWSTNRFTAIKALRTGDPQTAIEIYEPHVIVDGVFDTDAVGIAGSLANAYDLVGNIEKRDEVLDAMEAEVNRWIANGLWQFLAVEEQVVIAAIRGDNGRAFELMTQHMDTFGEINAFTLQNAITFRKLREDSRFPAFLEEKQALEARWRAAVAPL